MNTITPHSDLASRLQPEMAPLSPAPVPTPIGLGKTDANTAAHDTDSVRGMDATAITDHLAVASPLPMGTQVAGYAIEEFLGRGGMGIVVKARQVETGHVVAIKMIRDGFFADPESVQRFLREIQALDRAQQIKNIIPVYHVGRHDGQTFYTMPYFAQGCLGGKLRSFRDQPRKAVTVIEKIARAVHELHLQGILHRDIKPGNILLGDDDEPHLGDFGLIKFLDHDQSLTATNQRLGTPPYMAPEQTGLLSAPIDERTDVWTIGVLLYEILLGHRPFKGDESKDTSKLFWQIVHGDPPSPRKVRPALDPGLETVILKCLAKEPAQRYASAAELADDLTRWLRGEAPRARPESRSRRWWRASKGKRALTAAGMLAVLFGATAGLSLRPADPQRALADLQRQYATDKRVVLADDKKPLVWHEWLFKNPGVLARSTDGYHQISTDDLAVLALARDLPASTFRIRAKIRHDVSAGLDSEIGLFVACRPMPGMKEPAYLLYPCTFNDVSDAKELEKRGFLPPNTLRGNNFQLKYKISVPMGAELENWEPMWVRLAHFEPAGHLGGRWREIVMEAHADRLVARIDDKSTFPLDLREAEARLTREIPEFFTKLQMPVPVVGKTFDPQGNVGIFVTRGIASFKDVVVESLPSQ